MHETNYLPKIDMSKSTTGCCTLIEVDEWDDQTFVFEDKLFAKASTISFMHIPLNMSGVMNKAQALIEAADAKTGGYITLSHELSLWRADHYFAVTKEVPGLEMAKLSGTFLTKVFEGQYSEVGNWYQQLLDLAKSKGKQPKDVYFFYTVCPKYAKTYGKNYTVGFVQVD
jgi:hypothetical protein